MKIKRHGAVMTMVAATALVLAACGGGGDDSTGGGGGGGGDAAAGECGSGALDGEGSSAQDNAIQEAIALYNGQCADAQVNYTASGSGTGRSQFIAGQVDFAGSDAALETEGEDGQPPETDQAMERCAGNPAWHLPMIAGPIAVTYNLEGVDQLNLTTEVIAQIFRGEITTWNDPAIAESNPDASLPGDPINVFYRSDDSGTTENFTRFLNASAPDAWPDEPDGVWTGAGEGRAQSAGVADGVAQTSGSITYVDWSYATDRDLGVAAIDNGGGPVELTGETAAAAVANAEYVGEAENDLRLELVYDTQDPSTYPAVLVTYEIVCSVYEDQQTVDNVQAFMQFYASEDAQNAAADIGYAPLDDQVRERILAAVDAISASGS